MDSGEIAGQFPKEKDRKKGAEIIANTILAVPYCIYSLGAWVQSFVPFRIQGLGLRFSSIRSKGSRFRVFVKCLKLQKFRRY